MPRALSVRFPPRIISAATGASLLVAACAPPAAAPAQQAPAATSAPATSAATAVAPASTAAPKPTSAPAIPAPAAPTAGAPQAPADIFNYTGADRQVLLEAGAKKEGALLWYTSLIIESYARPVADAFKKQYPFVNIDIVRFDSSDLVTKVAEEAHAGVYSVDVIEASYPGVTGLDGQGLIAPFTSPQTPGIPSQLAAADHTYVGDREGPLGLAVNTQLVPEAVSFTSLDDLLNPALKDKLSIQDTTQGIQIVGALKLVKGEDFVRKLGQQNVTVYSQSANSVVNLITAGEAPSTFPASIANTQTAEKKGAPIKWVPLDPVPTATGYMAVAKKAPHPYTAMLFLDFMLSDAGQKALASVGVGPVRQGVPPPYGNVRNFQRYYMDQAVPVDQYDADFQQWGDLFKAVFTKRAQ